MSKKNKKYNKKFFSCGKKIYTTEDDVIFVGREQMFEFGSQQLFYYFCDDCLAWHLTSKETKNRIS
jgi:hypothetical protein